MPCSGCLVAPRKELILLSDVSIFAAAARGIDHVAIVASGGYSHRLHTSVTNGERVFTWLPSPGHSKRQWKEELGLFV